MEGTSRDFVLLVHGFLESKNLLKTAKALEEESSIFVNLDRISKMIEARSWNEIEAYLACFVQPQQSVHSKRVFLIIKREKFLEVASYDKEKAMGLLLNEVREFSNDQDYNELFLMLNSVVPPLPNRDVFLELKVALENIPSLVGKLEFPTVEYSDVRAAINESLNVIVATENLIDDLETPLYTLSPNGRVWISNIPRQPLELDMTPSLKLALGP